MEKTTGINGQALGGRMYLTDTLPNTHAHAITCVSVHL